MKRHTCLPHVIRLLPPVVAAILTACSPERHDRAPSVFVSVPPHEYLARRIAGGRFEIHTLIGPGQNPHSFAPTPSQVARLSEARIYLRSGMEFEEALLPRITQLSAHLRIVDLLDGITLRDVDGPGAGAHPADHDHRGVPDPHVWLSPVLAGRQAAIIRDAFCALDPEGGAAYRHNYDMLKLDLDSLDRSLSAALAGVRGSSLFVFHPAFGYFADQYGLRQVAVEAGGKEPGAQALARLLELGRELSPRVLFVQPQYSQKSARAIAAQLGCAVVPIDDLPQDYLQTMHQTAHAIEAGLGRR